jgi:hypothetical protein
MASEIDTIMPCFQETALNLSDNTNPVELLKMAVFTTSKTCKGCQDNYRLKKVIIINHDHRNTNKTESKIFININVKVAIMVGVNLL